MKVNVNEFGSQVEIHMEAETKEDAAQLVRLGMNTTKEMLYIRSDVYSTGTVSSTVCIKKHYRADVLVPRRK